MLEGEKLKALLNIIPDDGLSEYARSVAIVNELKTNPKYARTLIQTLIDAEWIKNVTVDWKSLDDEHVSQFALTIWDSLNVQLLKQNGLLN